MTAIFLERRILGNSGKEILKCAAQIHDGHLHRVFGHVNHPGKLVSVDGIELTPQGGV